MYFARVLSYSKQLSTQGDWIDDKAQGHGTCHYVNGDKAGRAYVICREYVCNVRGHFIAWPTFLIRFVEVSVTRNGTLRTVHGRMEKRPSLGLGYPWIFKRRCLRGWMGQRRHGRQRTLLLQRQKLFSGRHTVLSISSQSTWILTHIMLAGSTS